MPKKLNMHLIFDSSYFHWESGGTIARSLYSANTVCKTEPLQ